MRLSRHEVRRARADPSLLPDNFACDHPDWRNKPGYLHSVAFDEDRAAMTAQHRSLARNPDAPMLPLAMDAALLQFRRLVGDAVAAERPA